MKLGKLPPFRSLTLLLVVLISTALVYGEPTPYEECDGYTFERLSNITQNTCHYIRDIDEYVKLVRSTPPVGRHCEEYPHLLSFDKDLKKASENTLLWDTSGSIRSGIHQTYLLVRQFATDFTRKYTIIDELAQEIVNKIGNFYHIIDVQQKINALQEDLQNREELKQKAIEYDNVLFIQFVTRDIESLNNRIEEMQEVLREDISLINEIKELVKFLTFVKEDSDRIKTVALRTEEEMWTFWTNLLRDNFFNHEIIVSKTLGYLEERDADNSRLLEEYKNKIEELEAKIERDRRQIEGFYNGLPIERRNVDTLVSFEFNINEKAHYRDELVKVTSDSKKVQDVRKLFRFLDADLKNMTEKTNDVWEAGSKAMNELHVIGYIFDMVSDNLDDMIKLASWEVNVPEALDAYTLLDGNLLKLKCLWEGIRDAAINICDELIVQSSYVSLCQRW